MSEGENKLRLLGYVLGVAVLVSLGLILSNYNNYLGLLDSMNKVVFSIDNVTHHLEDAKVQFVINFSILNPTNYDRLKFSSLQCQLYLVDGEQEFYLGATGYAPPVDVPLRPGEVRRYSTFLSVPGNDLILNDANEPESIISLRVRNVIHFSTPIRKYYQSININQDSVLQ